MNNYYKRTTKFRNLYRGMKKSCRNVRWKDSVVGFEANGLKNVYELQNDLENDTYKLQKYQYFKIYEPKERDIVATRIRDRTFQRSLCDNGFTQDITEHFVIDNPACQEGKGNTFTYKRLKKHIHNYYLNNGLDGWVLKCDIHHFFPSTPHDVAINAVKKRCDDEEVIKRISEVINSFGTIGLGLGSQVSQLVELAVLDDLDHYIKEQLHIKYYVRTMDDLILIHKDRDYLVYCRKMIGEHISNIGLKFNKKTTIHPFKQGIMFMKWKFIVGDNGKVLMLQNKRWLNKKKRKLNNILRKEERGELPKGTAENSMRGMIAHAEQGNTYKLCHKLTEWFDERTKDDSAK